MAIADEVPLSVGPEVTLLYCLRRLQHLSHEQFLAYWSTEHAQLVAEVGPRLGVIRYVQHHGVHMGAAFAMQASRGLAEPFDGIAAISFASWESLEKGNLDQESAAAQARLAADEACFIDHSRSSMIFAHNIRFPGLDVVG